LLKASIPGQGKYYYERGYKLMRKLGVTLVMGILLLGFLLMGATECQKTAGVVERKPASGSTGIFIVPGEMHLKSPGDKYNVEDIVMYVAFDADIDSSTYNTSVVKLTEVSTGKDVKVFSLIHGTFKNVLCFNPDGFLRPSADYRVTIGNGLKTTNGNLCSDSFTFRTVESNASQRDPEADETGVAVDINHICSGFNGILTGIDKDSIKVYDGSGFRVEGIVWAIYGYLYFRPTYNSQTCDLNPCETYTVITKYSLELNDGTKCFDSFRFTTACD